MIFFHTLICIPSHWNHSDGQGTPWQRFPGSLGWGVRGDEDMKMGGATRRGYMWSVFVFSIFCCQQCLKAEAYPKITQGLPVGFNWIQKIKHLKLGIWDSRTEPWIGCLTAYGNYVRRTELGSQTPETLAATSHLEHHLSGRCGWFLGHKACWSYTLIEVLHVSI